MRLVRASKIYVRWQSRISLSFATLMLIKCVVAIILSAHWFACIIALQTSLHHYARETWLVRFGYCLETESNPLMTVADCTGQGGSVNTEVWYLACFSWALLVITGSGVGEYPTAFSPPETQFSK